MTKRPNGRASKSLRLLLVYPIRTLAVGLVLLLFLWMILGAFFDEAFWPSARARIEDLLGMSPRVVLTTPDPVDVARDALIAKMQSQFDPNDFKAQYKELKQFSALTLFYATDRRITQDPLRFASERGPLEFGFCFVTIPRDHRLGEIESPRWYRLELSRDPAKHFTVNYMPATRDDVLGRITRESQVKNDGVLIFVHGFAVPFEDAALRTGQLAYDLGWKGPAGFFSWPSRGVIGLVAYTNDAQNAEWAAPDLARVLSDLAEQKAVQNIYVVAHSMGAKVLSYALAKSVTPGSALRGKLREVILAAPDIDADVFVNQIAPQIKSLTDGITVYASSKDKALMASKELGGAQRLGESLPAPTVIAGIDTIDATGLDTEFLGHSYYGQMGVLGDVYQLIKSHARPPRFGLQSRTVEAKQYWEFMQRN